MNPFKGARGGAAAFWAAAIACFVAACAALGAVAADRAAATWARSLDGALTLRVISPDRPDAARRVAAIARAAPGVASVRVMTPDRARELLGAETAPLPDLRLVEVELTHAGSRVGGAALERRLAREGYRVELFGPGPYAEEAAAGARRLAMLALSAAAIAGGAAALIAPLVARARARADRATVQALLESGARPGQALAPLAARAALEGLAAGVVGAGAAAALAAGLLMGAAPRLFLEGRLSAHPQDVAPLLAVALLSGALSGAGARAAGRRIWAEAEGRA